MSSSDENVTIRAVVIISIRIINVRCFNLGLFFNLLFLAIRDSGASQQLKIIKGVDIESDANIKDSLCHEEDQWFLSNTKARSEIKALCEIVVAQSLFLGETILVNVAPADKNNRVIIIIKIIVVLFCPF